MLCFSQIISFIQIGAFFYQKSCYSGLNGIVEDIGMWELAYFSMDVERV